MSSGCESDFLSEDEEEVVDFKNGDNKCFEQFAAIARDRCALEKERLESEQRNPDRVYSLILPKYRKELRDVYKIWLKEYCSMLHSPVHNAVVRTANLLMREGYGSYAECLDKAVDRRKYLLGQFIPQHKVSNMPKNHCFRCVLSWLSEEYHFPFCAIKHYPPVRLIILPIRCISCGGISLCSRCVQRCSECPKCGYQWLMYNTIFNTDI